MRLRKSLEISTGSNVYFMLHVDIMSDVIVIAIFDREAVALRLHQLSLFNYQQNN